MARPQYLIKLNDAEKVVKSKELSEYQKQGWEVIQTIRDGEKPTPKTNVLEHLEPESIETQKPTLDPQFNKPEEIQSEKTEEIKTPVIPENKPKQKVKKTDEVSSELSDSLICTVCGAKARTLESLKKNHNENCARAVGKTKKGK